MAGWLVGIQTYGPNSRPVLTWKSLLDLVGITVRFVVDVVVQWLALLPHSRKVLGVSLLGDWGLFVWSLYMLPVPVWVSSVYSGFLPQS